MFCANRTKTSKTTTMGRHTTYNKRVANRICDRIAEGEPLRQICRDETMPAWRTVYKWLEQNDDFRARFAKAKDMGFDAIAEEALEIANTPIEGKKYKRTSDGKEEETVEDMLGHRKLQIETRLKLLAKWSNRYSERMFQEVSGPGGGPQEHKWTVEFVNAGGDKDE